MNDKNGKCEPCNNWGDKNDPLGLNKSLNKLFGANQSMKREAVNNDRRLQDLATYKLTQGLTVPLEDLRDTLPLFAEYKKLVRRGSFTIEQLKDRVVSKYGVVTQESHPLDDVVFLDEEPEPYYGEE